MDVTLTRTVKSVDGIFGMIQTKDKLFSCLTLEHAYEDDDGELYTKVPPGIYKCTRYDSPEHGYEVFLVNGVPKFHDKDVTFIEFHIGNYNEDSKGCILVGRALGWRLGAKQRMLTYSAQAFADFMKTQKKCDSFMLTVV